MVFFLHFFSSKKSGLGFSLIEVMIVVSIASILTMSLLSLVTFINQQAQIQRIRSDAKFNFDEYKRLIYNDGAIEKTLEKDQAVGGGTGGLLSQYISGVVADSDQRIQVHSGGSIASESLNAIDFYDPQGNLMISKQGLFLNDQGRTCSPACTSSTGRWKTSVSWIPLGNKRYDFYLKMEPINGSGKSVSLRPFEAASVVQVGSSGGIKNVCLAFGGTWTDSTNNCTLPAASTISGSDVCTVLGCTWTNNSCQCEGSTTASGQSLCTTLGGTWTTRTESDESETESAPTESDPMTSVQQISAGTAHSCAVKTDGTAWCWGEGRYSQLGNGGTDNSSKPVQVSNLANVKQISAGGRHSCAVKTDGTAWCWGRGSFGRLGNGGTGSSTTSVQVSNLTNVKQISAGNAHSCAVKTDGTAWCWGQNGNLGRLGNGGTSDSSTPVQVSNLTSVKQISVSVGGRHSCAMKTDGTVWCWGRGSSGQLGNGGTDDSSTPVQVSNLTSVKQISVGNTHSCAVKTDGIVWCWGHTDSGQLGTTTVFAVNNNNMSTSPVQVLNLTNVKQSSLGVSHSCAVKTNGTAWCWGNRGGGRLGNGQTSGHDSQKVQVSNLTNVKQISTGTVHSCAVKTDGTVWCWGYGSVGQLGNGGASDSSTPVQVSNPDTESNNGEDTQAPTTTPASYCQFQASAAAAAAPPPAAPSASSTCTSLGGTWSNSRCQLQSSSAAPPPPSASSTCTSLGGTWSNSRCQLQSSSGGSTTTLVVHSQSTSVPSCPSGWSSQRTGYSFLGTGTGGSDGLNVVQDLGSPGSCLDRFVAIPFTETYHNRSNFVTGDDYSIWLLGSGTSPSRCVVCTKQDTHIVVRHSQSSSLPSCPSGYSVVSNGYSFMNARGGDHSNSPQDLGGTGSCLSSHKNGLPYIECYENFTCAHKTSHDLSQFLTTYSSDQPLTNSITGIGRCRICQK